MAFVKGQSGNPSGKNNRPWRDAINRAVKRACKGKVDYLALDALADALVAVGMTGDVQALKELGDRLDGKPAQALVGEDGQPLIGSITVTFVNP